MSQTNMGESAMTRFNYEDEVNAVKKSTENDPKMQKRLLEILEIERLFPDKKDEETRLGMLDDLIKQSVDEDFPTLADKKKFLENEDDL